MITQEYEERFQSGYREEIQNAIVFDKLNVFLVKEKLRILDAGGGTGFYSMPFAAQGHNVVILNISQKMLEAEESKASELGIRDSVKTVLEYMEHVELPGESCETVLCPHPVSCE